MGKITFGSTYSEILKVVDKLQYYEKFYICIGFKINQKTPISVIEKTTYPILKREHLIE